MQIDQMIQSVRDMTWSDWGNAATCFGALLGTLAFIWDVEKHLRKGPRLKFSGKSCTHTGHASGNHSYIELDVRNRGDEATTIESIEALQDGERFRKTIAYSTLPDGESIRCPVRVGPGGHIIFTLMCSNDVRDESTGKLQVVRPLTPEKPAKVFVRSSDKEKEIVVAVPACPPRPATPRA